MENAEFTPLDLSSWPRTEIFQYFSETTAPVSYSATMRLDVTHLRKVLRKQALKFFPTCLYLVTRAITSQEEFRLFVKERELGVWNFLSPQYPVFHPDDRTFTFLWTEYDRDFGVFYQRVLADQREYGMDRGIFSRKGKPPENCYLHACVPWLAFDSFSFHLSESEGYLSPIVETGKLVWEESREWLPVSLTINHAAADGWHVSQFFEEIQEYMSHPQKWL